MMFADFPRQQFTLLQDCTASMRSHYLRFTVPNGVRLFRLWIKSAWKYCYIFSEILPLVSEFWSVCHQFFKKSSLINCQLIFGSLSDNRFSALFSNWLSSYRIAFMSVLIISVGHRDAGDVVVSPTLKNWPLFGQKFSKFGQGMQLHSHVSEVVSIFQTEAK